MARCQPQEFGWPISAVGVSQLWGSERKHFFNHDSTFLTTSIVILIFLNQKADDRRIRLVTSDARDQKGGGPEEEWIKLRSRAFVLFKYR